MERLYTPFFRNVNSPQDFKGQRLADQIIQFSLIIFAIVSFLIGYVNQDLSMTALLMGVGILLTVLVNDLRVVSNNTTGGCSAVALL